MFDLDSKLFQIISRIGDLVLLNILFLFSSIPVFTIGASTTALYSVTKKMTKNEEGYIARSYFKAFKENFKQSTIMWLILLMIILILSADLYIGNLIENELWRTFFKGGILLAWMIAMFVIIYSLTLQCTFENTIKNTMKNALIISLGHAPWSIVIVILTMSPFIALMQFGQYIAGQLLAMMLIWFSGVAYINSFILNRIYKKYY